MELVDAYLARRALDYLVGFNLSPVLWRKLPGARSAGRVQSVALRLVVDRELEIEAFRTQEYWTVEADVSSGSDPFVARLVKHEGKRLGKFDLPNEQTALNARAAVEQGRFTINSVEKKPGRRTPPPPFTTSTLQQEASRKLGFDAKRTMAAAQRLYEGVDVGGETVGLITYMRTDGVMSTPEALEDARRVIGIRFGKEYVPAEARHYKTKAKNAQEAHEAIRPTSLARRPGTMKLEPDMQRLYELVWRRMIASQMEAARVERTTVEIESADGRPGCGRRGRWCSSTAIWPFTRRARRRPQGRRRRGRRRAPAGGQRGQPGERACGAGRPALHRAAAALHRATLVKKMEELGIGRPSTYASISSVLRDREYVRMDKNRFVPEDKGRLVTAFWRRSSAAGWSTTSPPTWRASSTRCRRGSWTTSRCSGSSGATSTRDRRAARPQGVIDELDEAIGPFLFPEKPDGSDARLCPVCGRGGCT
jgi:DNA topoisomerase-1